MGMVRAAGLGVVTVVLALVSACHAAAPAPSPPAVLAPSAPYTTAAVSLRGPEGEAVAVPVYVAASRQQRARGLMFREELPEGAGMLFVYPGLASGPYYMLNTRIPLSIVFYGPDGEVRETLDMEPCPGEPCLRYDPGVSYAGALEVNQGFFDRIGLDTEWVVELPDDLPAARS